MAHRMGKKWYWLIGLLLLVACGGSPADSGSANWDRGQWDQARWQ